MGFEQGGSRGKDSSAWGAYEGAGPLSRSASSRASATSNPTLSAKPSLLDPEPHQLRRRERRLKCFVLKEDMKRKA